MTFSSCEVPEGHFVSAADLWFQVVHSAGKAVGRKPFRERVRFEERAIDFLRAGRQNTVQADGIGHADLLHELPVHAPRTTEAWPSRHGISDISESGGSKRMAQYASLLRPTALSPPPSPSGHWCATPLPFAARDLRRQRVQLRLPEAPELTD